MLFRSDKSDEAAHHSQTASTGSLTAVYLHNPHPPPPQTAHERSLSCVTFRKTNRRYQPKPISYDLIQHFQTIINYPLSGSSFAGRSNLCRYNITFSVLRLLLETTSWKQLPIEIMRTYFRVSPLQHKGFFLPISRLPFIRSFISPFGVFCHSLLHLTPSRLDR